MINIQVYRSAISLYLDKAQSLLSKGKCRLLFFVESSKKIKVVKISRYLILKIALVVLVSLRLLIQAIISGIQLIKRWRYRDKSRSNLRLGEDSAWVLSSGKQSIIW